MTKHDSGVSLLGEKWLDPKSHEMGPSRPPSEAHSLLLRVTRGCPWHRCQFCSSHRTMKFGIRTVDEIESDILSVKQIADSIRDMAWRLGFGGSVREAAASVYDNPPNDSYRNVALWLYFEERTVFLQDADALVMKTPELVRVLRLLEKTFPDLDRVTAYSRSQTANRKSVDELREIHEAGLSRLHTGLESGCDEVLEFMQKGVTAHEHTEGGRKVVESGISLCEYVMPGLGGRRLSDEHARRTAEALNVINPAHIRLRSLSMREDLPLYAKLQSGEFKLLTDDEIAREIRLLISELDVTSYLASDHIENLLQEVEGQLPGDKSKMLDIIDEYLALPSEERRNFQLGRRAGYYGSLSDLRNPRKHDMVRQMLRGIDSRDEDFEGVLFGLKRRFLV